jgi:hypothetical protein
VEILSLILFVAAGIAFWREQNFVAWHDLTRAPCRADLLAVDRKSVAFCATPKQITDWNGQALLAGLLFAGSLILPAIAIGVRRLLGHTSI